MINHTNSILGVLSSLDDLFKYCYEYFTTLDGSLRKAKYQVNMNLYYAILNF